MLCIVSKNLSTILSATLLILLYAYFKHSHTYWRRIGILQLNPSFPFGDVTAVVLRKQNMAEKVKEVYDQMKGQKCVGMYFFSRPTFLPLDPVLIKNIQSTHFEHFFDRGIYYDEENDPISAHLFSIAGEKETKLFTIFYSLAYYVLKHFSIRLFSFRSQMETTESQNDTRILPGEIEIYVRHYGAMRS